MQNKCALPCIHFPYGNVRCVFGFNSKSYLCMSSKNCSTLWLCIALLTILMHWAICNLPGMVFPCPRCRGSFCGRCVRDHGGPAYDYSETEEEANGTIDEVADGMHRMFVIIAQRKASEAAADPAEAAVRDAALWQLCRRWEICAYCCWLHLLRLCVVQ